MLATTVAAIVVLSAPFIGELRSAIQARFPGHFALIVGVVVAAAIVAALALALVRIRERRPPRYGLIASAVVFAVIYAAVTRTGNAAVDAVERFHFVEYGIVTWLFYRAWRPLEDASVFVLAAFAGLLVGTADEWLQWFIPARVGELHDIFLNGAAIASGLLFSAGLDLPPRSAVALRRGSIGTLSRFGAVVVVATAAFIHVVHLGYEIADADIGSFRSRYTRAELEALSRARADEWRTKPPLRRPPRLSVEDQYATEGLLHVQRRNGQWAAGEIIAAWRENLILEKYYAPVLDAPSYVSATGHRWPPEQRADAAARASADRRPFDSAQGKPYESDAQVYPIYTWPKPIFWTIVAAIVVVVVMAGRRRPT